MESDNKRVAKNTLVLYFRMLFMMLIGLYTSRINLQSLGVEDYGIYNVVGGVVVMFSIINGSISASISRFLTFELGKNNIEKLKKIFSTSGEFYQFNLSSCIRQQNSLTAQFVSFSLANLANIFYPPRFLQ